MKIKDIGEFGFIDSITQNTIFDKSSVVVGIGDDCAVCKTNAEMDELLTTDMMVEGIHFSDKTTKPFDIGYRLATANISDIAAMGGQPKQLLLSVALTRDSDETYLQDIYLGVKEQCKKHGVNIVSGDTVSTNGPLVFSVTVTGEVPKGEAVLRSGAMPGDYIGVTNYLGCSRVGLETLLKGNAYPLVEKYSYSHSQLVHQRPEPQVKLGTILRQAGATSMNDISDGLASELNEIAAASKVHLVIEETLIPIHDETKHWCKYGINPDFTNPVDYAFYGGEDFQLVFTLPKEGYEVLKEYPDITFIGRVESGYDINGVNQIGVTAIAQNGKPYKLPAKGYNHFMNKE